MLDELPWLGKKEELEFREKKFSGKSAGKAWKYAQALDVIIRTRAIIFLLPLVLFYPVIISLFFLDIFSFELFIERLVLSLFFIVAGLLYNKYRIVSIIIASFPLVLLIISYLFMSQRLPFYKLTFTVAILFLLLQGALKHLESLKIKKELDEYLDDDLFLGN